MKLKPNQFYLPSGALITERPILYQTEMIQANLNDLKTQTRRTKGLNKINEVANDMTFHEMYDLKGKGLLAIFSYDGELHSVLSPYGKPGDLLWAKETWFLTQPTHPEEYRFGYKAGGIMPYSEWPASEKFDFSSPDEIKPSIHMPKEASRIWSMVEDIRVERLQDISKEDAIAEGIGRWVETRMKSQPTHYRVYTDEDPEALYTSDPIDSYRTLWISINGQASRDANPWVWRIQYRILSKTGRPSMELIGKNYLEVMRKEVVSG